ncbi:MAG: hypothetical protein WBX15_03375 [Thermoanaerobaculia bacterium]
MRMKKFGNRIARELEQRGSALLVSLMVMVGLSLLGLGFVALSETESTISLNQRNYVQTLQVAEAGARAVVEWFQDPEWNTTVGLMPAVSSRTAFLPNRVLVSPSYTGRYQEPNSSNSYTYFCCDRPFKSAFDTRLFGTEDHPDIWIRAVNDDGTVNTAGDDFLNGTTGTGGFNHVLFPNSDVRISEIRVYAPPIVGGTVNVNGYYEQGVGARYGLGTIRVTAIKRRDPSPAERNSATNPIVATRTVKAVISEWPFPGPQGPVQSNANINTGGAVAVHWGKETSQKSMEVKRPLVGLPWFDPVHRGQFEYGYTSASQWTANHEYGVGQCVYPTGGGNLDFCATAVTGGHGLSGAAEPAWAAGAVPDSAVTWASVPRLPVHTTLNSDFATNTEHLSDLISIDKDANVVGPDYSDPWFEARARGDMQQKLIAGNPSPEPFRYTSAGQDPVATPTAGYSNWFQYQDVNDLPNLKQEVIFPHMDYRFWKDTAVAGQGQDGVYFLQWVSADQFRDSSGTTKTFKDWTDITQGAKEGFYFFDAKNGQNPQIAGGATYLTPDIQISGKGGGDWEMSGFIYLNAASFGTTGIHGPDGYFNFPGEPYSDIGYPQVDTSAAGGPWIPATAGGSDWILQPNTAGNKRWDCQVEVGGDPTRCDIHLSLRWLQNHSTNAWYQAWIPDPYIPGCKVGTNADPTATCSDPHEPYLNLIYPQHACCQGAAFDPYPVLVGWEDPTATAAKPITRRPKEKLSSGALPTVSGTGICTDSSQFDSCTSNGYDRDGYLDFWTGSKQPPILNGVFYNEGTMSSQGNATYFGSVLINGDIANTGTPEVWFDERLIKNDWPPKEWPFPRVIITAIQTDE